MSEKALSENFNRLIFPSQHQFVIIDMENDDEKAHTRPLQFLPLTFNIDFKDKAENPPALTLLINPSNMSVQSSRTIANNFAREGVVVEEWGENQDVLQFQGSIGGYHIINPTVGSSGLNRYDRSKSVNFKNLMNLFMIYRNNGAIYQNTTKQGNQNSNRLISSVGLIRINERLREIDRNPRNRVYEMGDMYLNYDNYRYKGSFDEFSIEEDATRPFTLNYSFTFIVQSRIEVKDYRQNSYYTQEAFVGSDVQTYSERFVRAVNNALETSRAAFAQDPNNRR